MDNPNNKPLLCTVIVLNYFGEKFIKNTINSVLHCNFPVKQLEIIIVDNGSTDLSQPIIDNLANKYHQIKKLYLPKNLGFAGGNNEAIKIAKGKYIILLNNDCLVDKNWIKELVTKAESDDKIFSVNSKILLYPKYFDYSIPVYKDFPLQEVSLIKSHILSYGKNKEITLLFTSNSSEYLLEIPFIEKIDKTITLRVKFQKNTISKSLPNTLKQLSNLTLIQTKKSKNIFVCDYRIKLSNFIKNSYNKIQNCGNLIFHDGSGRDIGAEVKYMSQNYEKDQGQFNDSREVYSTCGAASLYRKDVLNQIGFLDDNFFMYYEDIELCERARLTGYKNIFCPTAIARHLHALSSREWSPFFIYHVEKGRMLHLFYHFPLPVFIKEYVIFCFKSILRLIKNIKHHSNIKVNFQYFKVIGYFIINYPNLLAKKISFKKLYSHQNVINNYQKIISGYWFFN